jgi:hypothetical protein
VLADAPVLCCVQRYSERAQVRAFYALDVPFDIPIFSFSLQSNRSSPDYEHYKVLGEKENLVLFRPRTWRGTDGHGPIWIGNLSQPFSKSAYYNASTFAKEINAYAPGTVSYIYMTSDGGAQLKDYFDLVPQLQPHVKVVTANQLTNMALQRHDLARKAAAESDDHPVSM